MDQIRVVFLGTSAGAPTRERNVACVAMVLDGRALLFDCGEGTQQQLLRGPIRLGAIDAVFITHLHGDHVYGLPGLIATLGLQGRIAPLDVYGPPGLFAYLEAVRRTSYSNPAFEVTIHELIERTDDGRTRKTPPTSQTVVAPPTPAAIPSIAANGRSVEAAAILSRRADGYRVEASPLAHSVPCLGFAVIEDDRPGPFDVARARELGIPEGPLFGQLQRGLDATLPGDRIVRSHEIVGPMRRGRRVVYCTDTRPCDNAVALARDADLLIHEATYANDLAAEAAERFHSTAGEAATVAARAKAQQLILTHFSARYGDVSPLLLDARDVFAKTTAAHDFAEYTFNGHEVLAPTSSNPQMPSGEDLR